MLNVYHIKCSHCVILNLEQNMMNVAKERLSSCNLLVFVNLFVLQLTGHLVQVSGSKLNSY